MTATAVGGTMALPTALAVGLASALLNGFGVAYLRMPSMIFTLGVERRAARADGAQTGGFAPQDRPRR
jgi:ribose transport system permease protein